MEPLPLARAFTLIEPGPVVLVTTHDGTRANVMTISWTMVLDFDGHFAITTGPWNHSWRALVETRACVLAIPPAGMIDTVVGIGMVSGRETDKFARFGLTALPGTTGPAPLLAGCIANIECRVREIVDPWGIVVLEAQAAHRDPALADESLLHAVGDGSFTTDGARLDRRAAMRSKVPPGV